MAVRKRCAWCGTIKAMEPRHRYCSKQCGAYGSTVARSEEDLSRRGKLGAEAHRRARQAKIAVLVAGLTAEQAYQVAYARGYNSGWRAARRVPSE